MTGLELQAFRKGLRLTQRELATEVGLSQGFIGEMERGEKPIEKRTELAVRYVGITKTITWGSEVAYPRMVAA